MLLKVRNNISTDDIIPAGTRVLPYWSNIPKVAEFAFEGVDSTYPKRAKEKLDLGEGHFIVSGFNYGQGSSARMRPSSYLGLHGVIAKSFARIHWQNLINFGVLPLTCVDPSDYDHLKQGDKIRIAGIAAALKTGREVRSSRMWAWLNSKLQF